jgi:hypothetical protein
MPDWVWIMIGAFLGVALGMGLGYILFTWYFHKELHP